MYALLACLTCIGCTELGGASGSRSDGGGDGDGELPGDGDGDGELPGDGDGDSDDRDSSVDDAMSPVDSGDKDDAGDGDAGDGDGDGDAGDGDGDAGDGDAGDGDASSDDAPPSVVLEFPRPGRTEADAITVRGLATDPDGDLASVDINGTPAALDEAGRFSARLPLAPGVNTFTVRATDARGATSDEASVRVERAPLRLWNQPVDVAFHHASNEALVLDGTYDAVFAVDVATGKSRIIAAEATASAPALSAPQQIEVDPSSDRALVYAGGGIAIIDLDTLERTVMPLTLGDLYITGMAYDQFVGKLFAVGGSKLFTIDLETGTPTVVSDDANAAQGPALQAGTELAIDSTMSRVLVAHQYSGAVFSVDIATGNRTQLPAGSGPAAGRPVSLLYDRSKPALLIGDEQHYGIIARAADGTRTVVSDGQVGGGPALGHSPQGMAFVAANKLLVADWRRPEFITPQRGALTVVDSVSGHRRYLPYGIGSGQGLAEPMDLALDEPGERLLLVDYKAAALIAIHLPTGNRLVLSDAITGGGPLLRGPIGLALDLDGDRAFIADSRAKAIFRVDLRTGDRVIVSSNDGVGAGVAFEAPRALLYDAGNARLLVADPSTGSSGDAKIISVDLGTGNRVARSDDSRAGPGLQGVRALALGPSAQSVLAVAGNNVLSVDLASGDRTFAYDGTAEASNTFYQGFATDGERWILSNIVLGEEEVTAAGVVALARDGHAQEQLSNALDPGQGPVPTRFYWGGSMALHADVLFMSLADVGGVLAIDLVSGDRVIFSM